MSARCKPGQDVFSAAREAYGSDVIVDAFTNAYHSKPDRKMVEKYGQPVGSVTIRQGEWRHVYRIK